MKLIINKRRWLRGDPYLSRLYRQSDQKMCCLGFLSRQCGINLDGIRANYSPEDLEEENALKLPKGILLKKTGTNSKLCNQLININDCNDLNEFERQAQLKKLFKKIDVDVEFK